MNEWVLFCVYLCLCLFLVQFFFFFTYLLLLTLYSGSPQKDHGAAATEQDWSDIQLAETSESHRPASLDVSFDAIAAKPTFLTWLTLGRINLGPARAVRAMTEILIFLLSRVRVNWVIYRKKEVIPFVIDNRFVGGRSILLDNGVKLIIWRPWTKIIEL